MALDFPNSPTDGQVYTDPASGEQWLYEAATNSWTSKGLVNTSGGTSYKGSLDITAAPPAGAQSGWMYSALATGTANAGFGPGLTGTVTKGDLILFTGSEWTDVSHSVPDATAAVKGVDKKLWKKTGTALAPETAADTVQISAGTAALPGLTPVGDPNTGVWAPAADTVAVSTNSTERLRINRSGKLLVGTSSAVSTAPLQVMASNDGAWAFQLRVRDNANDACYVGFSDKTGSESIANISLYRTATSTGDLTFETNNGAATSTERMRLTSDAYVRLAAGSGGIQFNGDTAAANALNEYEEGTWTPGQGGGLTVVGAFSSVGRYTRVGELVFVSGLVSGATSIAATAGGILLTGLPFPTAGGDTAGGNCTDYNANLTAGLSAPNASTSVYVNGNITASNGIPFSFTYRT